MRPTLSDQFYTNLNAEDLLVSELLSHQDLFHSVPTDWSVIITDIKGSTQAVSAGKHNEVNLIATGSIILSLNIARKYNSTLPFFFGGDGATLLIPPILFDPVYNALLNYKENTLRNFNLDLRVGHVSVAEIYKNGHQLNLSKVRMSRLFSIPILVGSGLDYAEKLIKKSEDIPAEIEQNATMPDLQGMECRWNRIKPPENYQEVICLIVVARVISNQAMIFKNVLDAMDDIYGPPSERQPISVNRLKLKATVGKVRTEMKARLGKFNLLYLLSKWFSTLIGKYYYFPFDSGGRRYLRNLVQLSDTFVMDGRINTVISGNLAQRQKLTQHLDKLEKSNEIFYGIHACTESIMSCYVRNRNDEHIHFVDGSEGGYTQAARMLKRKIRNSV